MDTVLYVALSGGGLFLGVAGTIVTVRRGMISKETCEKCGKAKDEKADMIRGDIKDLATKTSEQVKGLYEKIDDQSETFNGHILEQTRVMSELVGQLKAKGDG